MTECEVLSATKALAGRVLGHDKIDIVWNTEVVEFLGKDKLDSMLVRDSRTA